jgi:epoxyqueuosine reductase
MVDEHDLMTAVDGVLRGAGVDEWGVARADSDWPFAPGLPLAVSIVMRHRAAALEGLVEEHMSQAFYDDYLRLVRSLHAAGQQLVALLEARGYAAVPAGDELESSEAGFGVREPDDWGATDVVSHKTAATQAGLGWIGKTALFVSARYGPAVRLTSVYTDAPLVAGRPVSESRCGSCRACVDACQVGAGRDVLWTAGMARDELYDEKACEAVTWTHIEWNGTCGTCQAACPLSDPLPD